VGRKLDTIAGKIVDRVALARILMGLKLKSKKIVFTNGCFDIVHQGHVDYLSKAADLGDVLVVGVNTDASVRRLGKGITRPIQDEYSRALLMAALHFVDFVVVFDEDTPLELIDCLAPDVLVKGADYTIEKVVGHELVLERGGEVKLIEFLPGFSTSAIEKKIKESNG